MNGYLYVIKGELGVKLSNYKDITTLYLVTNKTESSISYLPINLISNNLIDNMDVISAYKKNSIVGATKYNDTIDATLSGYAPTGKNIKTNKGLTIKGKGGNDTITGTQYNDTIVGGSGQNKVIYNSTTFGTDTIKLTKGETLLLKFEGDLNEGTLSYARSNNKKDLIIRNSLADGTTNKVIIKNYCAKDLGATVGIYNKTTGQYLDASTNQILPTVNAENYFQVAGQKIKKSYTGSVLMDNINASGMTVATNAKKGTGVTINGGAGMDTIIGSKFNDTIKGGKGNDHIRGYKGNDKLYGVSGNNTFYFFKGDEKDVIYSGKGEDTVNFTDSSFGDIAISRGTKKASRNLIINYGDGDSVTIKNYFNKKGKIASSVKKIITTEGTFNLEDIVLGKPTITSTDGNTVILFSDNQNINCNDGKTYFVYPKSNSNINVNFGSSDLDDLDITTDGNNVVIKGTDAEGSVTLCQFGTNPSNVTVTGADDETKSIIAGSGTFSGTGGDDIIFGSKGADTITAGAGNDIIVGGKGNDILSGGAGNDTYLFNSGDGNDTVNYDGGVDVLKFSDSEIKDLFLSRGTDNIVITNGKDGVTVNGYAENSIKVEDKNGVQYTLNSSDTLSLHAENGNDIFYAGAEGNNFAGGEGTNTYIISQGNGNCNITSTSGADVVQFRNTKFDDLTFSIDGKDFIIKYSNNENDKVVIDEFFANQKDIKLVGSDGTYANLVEALNIKFGSGTINGTNQKDIVAGSNDNDTITGKKGDDRLIGLGGNDTYVFNDGDGNDIVDARADVGENARNDILKFNNSTLDDLTYDQIGNNLIIKYNDGADSVTVYDYFKAYDSEGENNKVTKIKVGVDDTEYSIAEVNKHYVTEYSKIQGGYSYLTGTALNDIFTSTAINEVMTGFGGKNTYNFTTGGGEDYVFTTSGQDVINFTDVRADSLTLSVSTDGRLIFSYGSGNDKVILQDYLTDKPAVTITGIDNTSKTVAEYLAEYEAANGPLGASINSFMQDVAGWVEADTGIYQDTTISQDYATEDLTAVFVNA